MKELYISPEMEILCFAPMEGIASFNPVLVSLKSSKPGLPISDVEGTDYVEETFGDDF